MRGDRNGYSVSISTLIILVLGLIFLWFVGIPIIGNILKGAQSAYVCDGECLTSCGSGYRQDFRGNAYCAENFNGAKCCQPLTLGKDSFVRSSDVKLYYNNDKTKALRDGTSVELTPKKVGNKYVFQGTFTLAFGKTAKDALCYWQVKTDDEEASDYSKSTGNKHPPFQDAWNQRKHPVSARTAVTRSDLKACSDYAGESTFAIPFSKYSALLGHDIKFTLIIVDKKSCDASTSLDQCSTYTHSVFVRVPDRSPSITLTVNDQTASSKAVNELVVGKTNKIKAIIAEQYATCTLAAHLNLAGAEPKKFKLLKELETNDDACFGLKPWQQNFDINVPDDTPRAIPFTLTVNTSFPGSSHKDIVTSYPFRIAPEQRVRVTGPAPGLAKEKNIDITCNKVACRGFTVAYLPDPLDCHKTGTVPEGGYQDIDGLAKYGAASEARWRYTLKTEDENGKYVCIKADTNEGDIYSLGLYKDVPTPIRIDATPPILTLSFSIAKSFESTITMSCADPESKPDASFTSGCAQRPYSYAYVTDPLSFATRIITGATGGGLAESWHGCPDPETGYWVRYNSDREEMEYRDNAVKVLCMRAEDAAGNYEVQSKLLYNGQEMLALFLKKAAEEGWI